MRHIVASWRISCSKFHWISELKPYLILLSKSNKTESADYSRDVGVGVGEDADSLLKLEIVLNSVWILHLHGEYQRPNFFLFVFIIACSDLLTSSSSSLNVLAIKTVIWSITRKAISCAAPLEDLVMRWALNLECGISTR